MSLVRRIASFGTVLLLLSTVLLVAGDADADSEQFDRALERIHERCKREQYDSALRKLKSLLKKHAREPYARARRVELEDLAERIAFGKSFTAPQVGAVVSGRVAKWDCETGYLHVHYTPLSDGDLEGTSGGWIQFPGRITGPFLIDAVGDAYPGSPDDAPRMLLRGFVDERTKKSQSWLIVFGTPRREVGDRIEWMPARILHYDGDREREMVKLDKIPVKAGTRFRVQLKVTKDRITVGINGKTMFNRRCPRRTYGTIAFDIDGWETMTFAGTIEPAWIQDRLDKLAQDGLERFRETYKRTRYLPSWLFEEPRRVASAPLPAREALPVAVAPKLRSALGRARRAIAKRDWDAARKAILELEKGQAPRSVTSFLAARVDVETGRLEHGLAALDTCLEDAPEFLDALLLKAGTQRRLGRTDAAYLTFKDAIEHHGREPIAYEEAAISMLYAACPDKAQEVAELAVKGGVSSPNLDLVGRMVVKARRGPTWSRTWEYRSRNYQVLSDISRETCIEAAKILEEALVSYRVNLGWVTHDKTRLYPVYLFSGRRGFMEYMSEFTAMSGDVPDQVAGLYNPLLKQLLIWHLPKRDQMFEVVRHEGFHQYLDRLLPDAPIWFNEGLAVYHEKAEMRRGKLHVGLPHRAYLDVLKEKDLIPLGTFLHWTRKEFYAAAPLSYAQAWALIHLLKEGKPKHRALFKRLIKDLQEHAPAEAIRTHLPASSLNQLTNELQGHIGGLRRR